MASAINDAKKLAKYNNELEQANVKLQYDYNRSLAQEDRAWQERMANSAHQREIADLKAAGLNPVLSVSGGNGSATPGGSASSVSKPNVDMSLPRAVMDMAIAQLNSATNLQMTAMNNATSRYMHDTPGANSYLGLAEYLLGSDLGGKVPTAARNAETKSKGLFKKIGDYLDNSKLEKKLQSKLGTGKRIADYSELQMAIVTAKLDLDNLRTKQQIARLNGERLSSVDYLKLKQLEARVKRYKQRFPKEYKSVI